MTLTPFALIWAALVVATIGLGLYRKLVASHEDDYIHVSEGESKLVAQQVAVAQKLDVLDRWARILIITSAVTGVLLGIAYLYKLWVDSSKPVS
jgi:hypothetical protein